jgi:hypothetical protein
MEKQCAYSAVVKYLCARRITFTLQTETFHDGDPDSIPDHAIEISDGQGNTGVGICPTTSVFPRQYYSTRALHISLS